MIQVTLEPYPGLKIGDMGHKIGLNGVDNGFMILNKYRVPRMGNLSFIQTPSKRKEEVNLPTL